MAGANVCHWDDLLPDELEPDGELCIVPLVLPELPPELLPELPPKLPPELLSELPPEVPPEVPDDPPEVPLEAGGAEGAAPGVDGVEPDVDPGLDGLEGEAPGVVLVSAGGDAEGGGVDCVEGVLVVPDWSVLPLVPLPPLLHAVKLTDSKLSSINIVDALMFGFIVVPFN